MEGAADGTIVRCSSFINALQREVVDVTSRPLASPSLLQQSTSPAFDTDLAKASYATAGKRLILLDLEGTLCDSDARLRTTTETSENIDEFKLSDSTAKILEDLAGDKKNCVYILSGYSARSLSALTRRFPDIGYVAENGCFLALPAKSISEDRVWHSLVDESHNQWRQPVLNALRYYTERTPGSCIDDRGLSIVWRYADVLDSDHARTFKTPVYDDKLVSVVDAAKMPIAIEDSEAYEWARRQAAEVQNHIMDSLGERFGLRLHPGATSFLILPRKAGRAMAVGHILQKDNFLEEDMPIPERPNPTRPPFTHAQSEADLHEDAEIQDDDNPVDPDDSLPLPAEQDAGVVHAPRRTDVRRVSNKQNLRPKELDKVLASRRLQEQYDYVLAIGEDQRLCSWLGDMALDTVVTVSVGGKKRGARWQLRGPAEVTKALAGLAEVA
ncbi:Trehalose-6-P synthase/phosphatase complex subunit [Cystobasidiomycetes sp. EMM_F5]